ncbi:MAG: endonuclease/exonuclease/phosphatase family protein [Flavobacteriales bacterium]
MKKMNAVNQFLLGTAYVVIMLSASCEHVGDTDKSLPKGFNKRVSAFDVVFYNVENLFDTADDRWTEDEDFTPNGKLKWTEERYQKKLASIAEVLDSISYGLPHIVGLCEVENKKVLEDLVGHTGLAGNRYGIIHRDSPDERGIDVAMLYDSAIIKIEFYNYTTINLPDSTDTRTRDLLYVKAIHNGTPLHLFLNHWPSRGGGQAESEHLRVAVANVLHMQINKLLEIDKNANILVMGDFNDFPNDKSIAQTLNAGVEKSNMLYNYMFDEQQRGEGSYFYKGAWSPLDQFMASKALHEGKNNLYASASTARYFKSDFLMFDSKEGKRPSRTYVGEDYKGGYSDHLPILIEIYNQHQF